MGGKRRWVELGKDAAIGLLAVSAVWLLFQTPLVRDSGLLPQRTPAAQTGQTGAVTPAAAAYPARMALNGPQGRYGVQYDQEQVDALFAQSAPLLGEALVSAGQPERISRSGWERCLQAAGIYFDFSGQIPLSALGSWLQPGEGCALEGSARRLVLAQGEEGQVLLCYQGEDGGFYACQTALSSALHLSPALEGAEENGARFAFEDQQMAPLLDPYTLLAGEAEGTVYAAANPLAGGENLASLLERLSFSGQNHTSISGGEAYLEGDSRLEVRSTGTVLYRSGQQGKYPVASSGGQPTLAEMIEAVRGLAEGTAGAWCGQARLCLSSARQTQEGWLIQFGYQLEGSGVWLYEEGWAAQFLVRDGYVAEFTLHLRAYTAAGERALMLPVERAAAMLPGLTQERAELVVQYRDQGEDTVKPIWVAQ